MQLTDVATIEQVLALLPKGSDREYYAEVLSDRANPGNHSIADWIDFVDPYVDSDLMSDLVQSDDVASARAHIADVLRCAVIGDTRSESTASILAMSEGSARTHRAEAQISILRLRLARDLAEMRSLQALLPDQDN